MGILTGFGIFGTACFCIVEWSHRQKALRKEDELAAKKLNVEVHSD